MRSTLNVGPDAFNIERTEGAMSVIRHADADMIVCLVLPSRRHRGR